VKVDERSLMPKDKTMSLLQEALTLAQRDADALIGRLTQIYRDEEKPQSTEQVIALGFLTCARALREASLMEEIAVREEIQDLGKLIEQVLVELRRTEETVRTQAAQRRPARATLEADLHPSKRSQRP
jgi:hypothetical protein